MGHLEANQVARCLTGYDAARSLCPSLNLASGSTSVSPNSRSR